MLQIKEEFDALLQYAKGKKLILEIGTAWGGTLCRFIEVADDSAEIVSIDMPGGKYGGKFGQPSIDLMMSWAKPNQKLHIIRADSHAPETVENVRKILNGRKFDFIFIDGDHSYGGVKKDYENYKDMANDIIAFHDITNHFFVIPGEEIEVDKFWHELRGNKTEIIKDKNQGRCGIGVLKI